MSTSFCKQASTVLFSKEMQVKLNIVKSSVNILTSDLSMDQNLLLKQLEMVEPRTLPWGTPAKPFCGWNNDCLQSWPLPLCRVGVSSIWLQLALVISGVLDAILGQVLSSQCWNYSLSPFLVPGCAVRYWQSSRWSSVVCYLVMKYITNIDKKKGF